MSKELEKIAKAYGDGCMQKQQRKRQKLLIADIILDYAKNSTLHGLRYIAEKGLTTIEKVFWLITFVASVAFCCYCINNIYIKWKTSPVIITVSERLVSIGEVPFPSVTICPQIKSKATVYNLNKKANRQNFSTLEEQTMFNDISILCSYNIMGYDFLREFTNASIIHHINQVAPRSAEILLACSWRDQLDECKHMFQKVNTAEGVCFNMNGLSYGEMIRDTVQNVYKYSERNELINGWSLENGYSFSNVNTNYFPKRGSENGFYPDLQVVLMSNTKDNDGLCNGLNSGYKIYLYIQHPADFPQSSVFYYAALHGQVSSLAMSFNYIESPEALKDYSVDVRQCYFPDNRHLRYFKMYTANNCHVECLSNYTFQECECVGYYMPHDNSSQICAEEKLECMKRAHLLMANKELELELEKSTDGCHCLLACNTVEYEADVLMADFNLESYIKLANPGFDAFISTRTKYSKLDVFFKKPQFVSMKRSEVFGTTDFLDNIGGLLGVFLGFSFLSLIELVYFITLRVGYSLKRDLKEENKNIPDTIVVEMDNGTSLH